MHLARAGDPDGDPIPAHVEREFRQYLTCGILAHGFARARCAGCGHDFLVAFSCKGRGVCPSCGTRRMAETAAHLVDHVFPEVPVRQWVLSLPKRLRYFLHHGARLVNPVLRIFLAEVEAALRLCSPDAPSGARFGAVTFVHRFGSALNANLHFHCCVIDGLFSAAEEGLRFHPACLTEAAIARVQQQTRRRVLKLFERCAVLPEEATALMLGWEHSGGFSLHAGVWVPAWDRAGLERLLRYCARPTLRLRSGQVFAGERLAWIEPDERLIYYLPKPRPNGQMVLTLTPVEFLDRLAALVPPPRKHRHRYHGVLAPHSPLRPAVAAYAGLPLDGPAPPAYLWAVLLARIYAVLPLICPVCGSEMRLIAAVTEPEPVQRILRHIGKPVLPPPVSPARSPPEAETFDWDQTAREAGEQSEPSFEQPPEIEFDQTVNW